MDISELVIRGTIITPEQQDFDSARSQWNAMVDKRPAAIIKCVGTSDVIAGLGFAQANDLQVRIRAGGHSVAGHSNEDGVLVLDLSPMRWVHVDLEKKIASIGPGTLLGDLDAESQLHGLAVPAGVDSRTGVAGLALGGGQGFLSRSFGLTCDNLLGAEVITAAGQLLQVDANNHADLFWALQGAGHGIGVVTRFDFQLHDLGPDVAVAQAFYPSSNAAEILRAYRDFNLNADDATAVYALCVPVPAAEPFPTEHHGGTAIALVGCYAGDVARGLEVMQPITEFGETLFSMLEPMPYRVLQNSFTEGAPDGGRYYWKSNYLSELSDAAIEIMAARARGLPGPFSNFFLEPLGGAVASVATESTPFPHRNAQYSFGISSGWEHAAEDDAAIEWTKSFHAELSPLATGNYYINYMDKDEQAAIGDAFGENYARVKAIKAKYDPEALFG